MGQSTGKSLKSERLSQNLCSRAKSTRNKVKQDPSFFGDDSQRWQLTGYVEDKCEERLNAESGVHRTALPGGMMPSLRNITINIMAHLRMLYRLVLLMYFYLLETPVRFMMVLLIEIYKPILKYGPIYAPTLAKALQWTFNKLGFLLTCVTPFLFDLIYWTLTFLHAAVFEYGLPFLVDIFRNILLLSQEPKEIFTGKFAGRKTLNDKWSKAEIESLAHFSDNFQTLLENDQLSDFTIKVKNVEIRIHRPILAARSPVFASMLEVDGASKNQRSLTLADCDLETFRDFMHYLYTGKTERVCSERTIGLFEMASKYAVPLLKEECERFLKGSISVDTVCDVLSTGLRLDEARLILMATQCFLANSREILRTLKWQKFLEENTDAANQLILGSLDIPIGKETASNVNGADKTLVEYTDYKHLINLSESIETLFLNDHFSDFTIKVSDREFKVHKAIVASQSSVFATMLQHEMKESVTGILEVSDCYPEVFEDFLFYLYSGKTGRISETNAVFLYCVADKYNVCKLEEECCRFMKENISLECFCDVMVLATVHRETDLIEVATNYFISNAKEIIASEKWRLFSRENTTVANELYIKTAESVRKLS